MITLPISDLLLLPGVTFFFKKDVFPSGEITAESVGEDILFIMEKEEKEQMTPDNFYPIGVIGTIDSVDEEGNVRVKVRERVQISDTEMGKDGVITADASILPDVDDFPKEEEKALFEKMKQDILRFVKGFPWGVWARGVILHWKNVEEIGCALSSYFNITWEEKYGIIETDSRRERCKKIEEAVYEFMEIFHVGEEAEEAQKEIHEQAYRESAIKKQIELLQQQLDEMHPENISDVRKFETKIAQSGMNEEARKEAEKVLNRMKQEGKDSHEYGMLYDYLDFVTSLSWKTKEQSEINLQEAEEILDEDHYGLKKVKERIIQQLAVMALNKKQSGSILLFVGAPGTGKTSIGQSIARALHREYVRISLGGIRDEAEIRGHRRTYVGAMPGRIMEGMKRSKAQNPVMVLDEVDKLAKDYGGDPASALLEVLDPEHSGINLFDDDWKIYSRNSGMTGHKIAAGAIVENSMITDGCRIQGTVKHSVLYSGVKVEDGAVVEDAVVMGGCVIKSGAVVRHCIIAEKAVIGENAVVGAAPEGAEKGVATIGPGVYIGDGAKVGPNAMVRENVEGGEEVC